jgi:hypothetical protein
MKNSSRTNLDLDRILTEEPTKLRLSRSGECILQNEEEENDDDDDVLESWALFTEGRNLSDADTLMELPRETTGEGEG